MAPGHARFDPNVLGEPYVDLPGWRSTTSAVNPWLPTFSAAAHPASQWA